MAISYRNRLLAAVSRPDLALLGPHLERTDLPLRMPIEAPNGRIKAVYFIEAGIASVVAVGRRKQEIEVGIIGREGMTGLAVVLGDYRSPHATYVQVAGHAYCVPATVLRQLLEQSQSLHGMLLKSAQAFMIQTAHTAVANGRARLDERLARWLLMAHDRIDGDELPLTHEFLALMLGVRRPGVTVGLHTLELQGLIRSARRSVTILDRKGIEVRAGAAYGVPEAELRRLFT
jgi:CRP-like cAMP-binding protein